jgi:hypothetical protein
VNISVSQLDFGTQVAGTTSASKEVVISGIDPADAAISWISIMGEDDADSIQTDTCPISPGTLAANARCEVHVIFQSRNNGELSEALSIEDNAPPEARRA